jgi:hypothetical protein
MAIESSLKRHSFVVVGIQRDVHNFVVLPMIFYDMQVVARFNLWNFLVNVRVYDGIRVVISASQ